MGRQGRAESRAPAGFGPRARGGQDSGPSPTSALGRTGFTSGQPRSQLAEHPDPTLPVQNSALSGDHQHTSLYAALEIATGRVIGDCTPRHTGADFLRFIQAVVRRYRGRELHVVLDNSSTHSTPAVQTWLRAHPEVQFHFTPKGASWLNMVEAWFGILTRKSVRRGSFDTVRALIRHLHAYIANWNTHPTPFVWTKDPAAIVKKALGRGR